MVIRTSTANLCRPSLNDHCLQLVLSPFQRALESWIVQSLQPAFDDLDKPAWVGRVLIQQFYLGEEPITIRSVQRRVSRRANDLQ